MPRDVEVRLCVYDVLGRLVGVVVDGRVKVKLSYVVDEGKFVSFKVEKVPPVKNILSEPSVVIEEPISS